MIYITPALLIILGLIITFVIYKKFYHKVEQSTVLIINGVNDVSVHFDGGLVLPVIDKKMVMEVPLMSLEIDRSGAHGLTFVDDIHADITVVFNLHVGQTTEDVLKVSRKVGVARASKIEVVHELFYNKFSEALVVVAKQFRFVSVLENNARFNNKVLQEIGNDLHGYVIEELKILHLEQTHSLA